METETETYSSGWTLAPWWYWTHPSGHMCWTYAQRRGSRSWTLLMCNWFIAPGNHVPSVCLSDVSVCLSVCVSVSVVRVQLLKAFFELKSRHILMFSVCLLAVYDQMLFCISVYPSVCLCSVFSCYVDYISIGMSVFILISVCVCVCVCVCVSVSVCLSVFVSVCQSIFHLVHLSYHIFPFIVYQFFFVSILMRNKSGWLQ